MYITTIVEQNIPLRTVAMVAWDDIWSILKIFTVALNTRIRLAINIYIYI